MARAPSMVAMRRTFQAGNTKGVPYLHLFSTAASFISLNMLWLLFPGDWSLPRPTRPPWSKKILAGGTSPSMTPMEEGQKIMLAPRLAVRATSSSVALERWTAMRFSSMTPRESR